MKSADLPPAIPASTPRRSLLGSFSRSQVASALASVVDFALLFGLSELAGVWYVAATAIGAAAGAITNFMINRHWSFLAGGAAWRQQAWRYAIVSAGSLLLNTGGVWLMTESTGVHYGVSVAVVTFVVGIAWNFPLQRRWVFKVP